MSLGNFDYAMRRKLQEEMSHRADDLVTGAPRDFAEYQHIRGQIEGIQFAIKTLSDLRERFEKDGGFGDEV